MNADFPSADTHARWWKLNPTTKRLDFFTLRVSADGLEVLENGRPVAQVTFSRVAKLIAFKHDLLTTDLICLVFVDEDNNGVIVHEEMPGFPDLFDRLDAAFPKIDRDWYTKVMHPAFATNKTVVWQRESST